MNHLYKDRNDVYVNKYGDFDADAFHIISVGGKKGFPESVANQIEAERAKLGEVLLSTEFEKHPKTFPTQENIKNLSGDVMIGEEAINITSATGRLIPSFVDTNMKISVSSSTGNNSRKYKVSFNGKTYKEGTIPADGQKHGVEIVEPRWNRKTEELSLTVDNEATDAIKSPALSNRGWEPDYLIKQYFNTEDPKIVRIIGDTMKDFQTLFSLSQKGKPIPGYKGLKDTRSSSEALVEVLDKYNALLDDVSSGGGTLSPSQQLSKSFKGIEGFPKPTPDIEIRSDLLGRRAVVEKFDKDIKMSPRAQRFIGFVEKTTDYASNLWKTEKDPKIKAQKSNDAYNAVIEKYSKEVQSFSKNDIDSISYWLITNDNGNFARASTGAAPRHIRRFDELFVPEQGRVYFEARESYVR